jgi:hypothetical protein
MIFEFIKKKKKKNLSLLQDKTFYNKKKEVDIG